MPSFNDLQNLLLFRARQRGVNLGGVPGNSTTDVVSPLLLQTLINMGYAQFVTDTLEAQVCVVKTQFASIAGAVSYPLAPLNATPLGVANPAALRLWEVTYTTTVGTNQGIEYVIDLMNPERFLSITGGYTRRFSWFGPRVQYATRFFRRQSLEVAPGTATAGDVFTATLTPDVGASAGVPATLGGPLVNGTDVPLIDPSHLHSALIEYALIQVLDGTDKATQLAQAKENYGSYVKSALSLGANDDGGEPTNIVDVWDRA